MVKNKTDSLDIIQWIKIWKEMKQMQKKDKNVKFLLASMK